MDAGALEVEIRPRWPVRLPARDGADGTMRVERGVVTRLVCVEGHPVLVRAWQRRSGQVVIHASSAGGAGPPPPERVSDGGTARRGDPRPETLKIGIERMRFALALDDDMGEFFASFRADPLLGPVIRRRPWIRPRRRPWPWEALAWAITKQLIESGRAAAIQRRIVRRWGPRLERHGAPPLADVPGPELLAARAPAELVSCDLSEGRALALVRCAREVAAGRVDPGSPADDLRLLAIREIGPWTVQVLGLDGRGEHDALPAGDLGYLKLVGRLAGLGRRATVEEVEAFFAPYAPYRGIAATFALTGLHRRIAQGPPLRRAA